jgi:6-pyruvoyltetrahydropterin/6-carboxytetrahydropterin synthase
LISLTRCYRFPAAHVLAIPSESDAENQRIYGKCANPAGHGHDYAVEVTVAGPLDSRTGRVIDPLRLDSIFEQRVAQRLSHRMLNELPLFSGRGLVPTAENIARVVFEELDAPLAASGDARLRCVRVLETRRNSFVYGEIE